VAWKIGERLADGRWVAPAAERNKGPILEVLQRVLPPRGVAVRARFTLAEIVDMPANNFSLVFHKV
jgi:hypothetical protein